MLGPEIPSRRPPPEGDAKSWQARAVHVTGAMLSPYVPRDSRCGQQACALFRADPHAHGGASRLLARVPLCRVVVWQLPVGAWERLPAGRGMSREELRAARLI